MIWHMNTLGICHLEENLRGSISCYKSQLLIKTVPENTGVSTFTKDRFADRVFDTPADNGINTSYFEYVIQMVKCNAFDIYNLMCLVFDISEKRLIHPHILLCSELCENPKRLYWPYRPF